MLHDKTIPQKLSENTDHENKHPTELYSGLDSEKILYKVTWPSTDSSAVYQDLSEHIREIPYMKGWKKKRKHGVNEGVKGTLWVLWKDTENADVEEAEVESEKKEEDLNHGQSISSADGMKLQAPSKQGGNNE